MFSASRFVPLSAAIAGLAMASCGSDDSSGGTKDAASATTATTSEPAATSPKRTGTTIKLDDSQYGPVLFDGRGQAIYLFDKEKSERSECYGDCAAAWPPVLTEGQPRGAPGIRDGLLGTTERRDGTIQVTYKGHPLYFYAHEGRNEVRCHNVTEFGGVWLALDGTGDAIGSG